MRLRPSAMDSSRVGVVLLLQLLHSKDPVPAHRPYRIDLIPTPDFPCYVDTCCVLAFYVHTIVRVTPPYRIGNRSQLLFVDIAPDTRTCVAYALYEVRILTFTVAGGSSIAVRVAV